MSLVQVSAQAEDPKPTVLDQIRLRAGSVAIPLGTAVSLLLIWQIGVRLFEVPTYIAPAPTDVLAVFTNEFALLMRNFWPTLIESLSGFLVGNLAAILIAVAFVHSRSIEKAFFPIAVFINTIPIL
ncbi:MAG: ABC transporter permease, partial [Rhodobacteraceae bacterium]|nr:ABC transporter permease [Paracoccaceae bacterium]